MLNVLDRKRAQIARPRSYVGFPGLGEIDGVEELEKWCVRWCVKLC